MNKNKNGKQEKSMQKIIQNFKKELKAMDIKWTEEEKYFDHIDFMLSYRGWYALCKVYTDSPYYCKYRMIGTPAYEKCSLNEFVEQVSSVLLHGFKDGEPEYGQQELQQQSRL